MIVMIYNWPFYPNVFLLLQVVGKRVSHHYYHCQNCHQTYCLGGSEWKTKMFGNAPAHLWIFPPVPIIAKPAYWSGTHKVWQNFSKTWIVLPHVYYTLKVRHYIFWLKKNIFKKSSIFLLLKSHICHPHKSVNRTTSRQFLSQSWYNLKNLLTTIKIEQYLCVWKALLAAHLVQTLVLVVKTKLDQFPPCGQNLIIS